MGRELGEDRSQASLVIRVASLTAYLLTMFATSSWHQLLLSKIRVAQEFTIVPRGIFMPIPWVTLRQLGLTTLASTPCLMPMAASRGCVQSNTIPTWTSLRLVCSADMWHPFALWRRLRSWFHSGSVLEH